MKKAIFVGEQRNVDYVYSLDTIHHLKQVLNFPYGKKTFSDDELNEDDFQDIHFLFSTWGMCELSEEKIARFFPKVECVFYAAGSVQRFARPFLNRGIKVFSGWAANAVAVSEFTLAQIILAAKGYYHRLIPPGAGSVWDKERKKDTRAVFPGNYDATVGVIGAGMIGKMVIQNIHKVLEHIRILVYDPFLPTQKAEELGVTLCDLETLFLKSDVITNHLANNSNTVGILNAKLFTLMKPTAVFINTGRGVQVVEADLIDALKRFPTRAAALDVTWPEPPEEDSPFYQMKNVFLTPHIAGSLGNEVHRMGEYMLEEYLLYAAGKQTRYEVTETMLDTMA